MRRLGTTEGDTMRKALTATAAGVLLVAVVAQASDAAIDRSLPTKHSRAQISKAAHVTKKKAGQVARPGVIVVAPGLLCHEQEPGDSGVFCVIVSPTYNDTAGT
jgi:hypothetical protein